MSDLKCPPASRRDFLIYSSIGISVAGFCSSAQRLEANPELAKGPPTTLTIDLSGLAEGAEMTVKFQGKPFVIRHRTTQEIAEAEADDAADLIDRQSRNENLSVKMPATDRNRRASTDGRIIVMSKLCTHMGCVVMGNGSGNFNGYFCRCHSAHFDTSGRVRKGPAVKNLPVPPYDMPDANTLVLLSAQIIPEKKRDALIYGPEEG